MTSHGLGREQAGQDWAGTGHGLGRGRKGRTGQGLNRDQTAPGRDVPALRQTLSDVPLSFSSPAGSLGSATASQGGTQALQCLLHSTSIHSPFVLSSRGQYINGEHHSRYWWEYT